MKKTLYFSFSVVTSSILTYWKPNALEHSMTALEAIISVFSILAGVLVAVISIIGDPSMLLGSNWRAGYEHAKEIQVKIANYAHLIFLYIIVLASMILCIILKDNSAINLEWIFTISLWLSILAFTLSLSLPYSLMAIQKERMKYEVEKRKSGVV